MASRQGSPARSASPARSGSPARTGSPTKSGSRAGSPTALGSPHYMQHIQSKATSTVPPRSQSPTSPRSKSPRPGPSKTEAGKGVHLPQFIRFKSQALCRYLMVHPDKRGTPGKLLFSGKQDKTNPYYMFETVHVPGMKQACKVKSMATGKFWKRVPLNKVPECKSAIKDGGFFSVILAKGESEFDADVFTYKKQAHEIGGLESKLVSLWSQDDHKFVAPFCIIKDEKTGDVRYFLGCKPAEEKYNNTYYFHAIYHQHWHVKPDPVVSLGKYGFGF
ncbi:hypothetical protein Mapa_013079 [Marchantia paleacea]|nr:hypothetical protein Mapa_013079 [Marchantia paleacea]